MIVSTHAHYSFLGSETRVGILAQQSFEAKHVDMMLRTARRISANGINIRAVEWMNGAWGKIRSKCSWICFLQYSLSMNGEKELLQNRHEGN